MISFQTLYSHGTENWNSFTNSNTWLSQQRELSFLPRTLPKLQHRMRIFQWSTYDHDTLYINIGPQQVGNKTTSYQQIVAVYVLRKKNSNIDILYRTVEHSVRHYRITLRASLCCVWNANESFSEVWRYDLVMWLRAPQVKTWPSSDQPSSFTLWQQPKCCIEKWKNYIFS